MSSAAAIANIVSAVLWVAIFVLLLIDYRIIPGRDRLRRLGGKRGLGTRVVNLTPADREQSEASRGEGL